jgi:hypothetical protein
MLELNKNEIKAADLLFKLKNVCKNPNCGYIVVGDICTKCGTPFKIKKV